jgi:CRISPR-associated endonuclease Csn1
MSKRILGLDLGTNSIGWAVVDDQGNGKFQLAQRDDGFKLRGVHIFQEAVNKDSKGSESSKAAQRTSFRSARRIKYRRKLRKIETLKVLSEFGYCPALEKKELNAWRYDRIYPKSAEFLEWQKTGTKDDCSKERNPYYLRWLAATEKLDLDNEADRYKLGRAFYHIAQRRGFKSNRKDGAGEDAKDDLRDEMLERLEEEFSSVAELCLSIELLGEGIEDRSALSFLRSTLKNLRKQPDFESAHRFLYEHLNKTQNLGKVKGEIAQLTAEMKGKYETLGQLFWKEYYEKGKRIRAQHTSRDEHYLAEFETICCKQGIPEDLRKKLYDAIFYQRPLKSQKGLVAKCPFEQQKKRVPVSHPFFEEFRMWQTLNNIKVKRTGDRRERPLTFEEKEKAIPKFFRAKLQFDFADIATLLADGQEFGYLKDKDCDAPVAFNYRADQTISGCPLTAKLMRLFGVKSYRELARDIYDRYTGEKMEKNGRERLSSEILSEVWHVLFSSDTPGQVKKYASDKLGLVGAGVEKFAKINPKQDYGSLSLLAIRRLLPYLRKGYLYSHAVFLANLDYVIGEKVKNQPELEEEIKGLIDGHGIYRKSVNVANILREHCRKHPEQIEDIHYWASKGWVRWCEEVREVIIGEDGHGSWDALYDSEQEAFFLQSRELFNKLKEDGARLQALTIEGRIKELLLEWAEQKGKTDLVKGRLDKLYHPSKEELYVAKMEGQLKLLGNPVISSIRNPVFNRGMHRLKAVVNELIRAGDIDNETVVHLEVANEMNDANRRAALRFRQDDLRKERVADKKALAELFPGHEVSDSDVLRYKLRREQRNICLYCGEEIGVSNLLSSDFQIEHTIPRSRCCDNSQENKTLAHLSCNQQKGRNVPYECDNYGEILPRLAHWKMQIDELEQQIEGKKRASKGATDKEARDKIIRARLGLQFRRDYLWGKYRRFLMEDAPEGFKNSQLVDTRIITKYARSYLSSVFDRVHTVNGKITDDFRHYWGLQDEFEKKDRSNHVHHAVDATVVACITRRKYQQLAEAYRKDEEGRSHIHVEKPWDSFVRDLEQFKKEILVAHYAPNPLLKQTVRKLKVKGREVTQKSKTARGSLHQDTFYGAIKRMEEQCSGKKEEVIKYVSRKPLDSLDDKQLKNIVDDRVREIVTADRQRLKDLKKEIEELKKKKSTVDADQEKMLSQRIEELQKQLDRLFTLPNKNGDPVPIKRVRVSSNLTNPIELKEQRDKSKNTRRPHKEKFYVNNDSNYVLEIFNGERRREFELYKNIEAANGWTSEVKKDAICLRKGQPVLLYKDNPGEVEACSPEEIVKRYYVIQGLSSMTLQKKYKYGIVVMMHALEGRIFSDLKVQDGDFEPAEPYIPLRKFLHTRFKALVEGRDFSISPLGELRRL